MENYVISFTDTPNGTGGFTASRNVAVIMKDGERATGPMSLFNRSIYFSSYVPVTTAPGCVPGYPRIWGVDYLKETTTFPVMAGAGATDPANGLDANGDGASELRYKDFGPGGVIFGIGINRLPSCVTTA